MNKKMAGLFISIMMMMISLSSGSSASKALGVYEVKRGNFSAKFTNWGATLISLLVPDRYGNMADVALGYQSVYEYTNDTSYFGSIVGRVANRIGGAQFTIDGIHYKLKPNEKNNMLHGGVIGFSDVLWKVTKHESDRISFSYHSCDGEEGFPGDLEVSVSYAIVAPYVLSIRMRAKSLNKATPVNLAQHTYWNIGGHNSGDVLSDVIQIYGSQYTPTDDNLIPTGKLVSVKGTPYDFLEPQTIGSRIAQLLPLRGYDMNYVLDGGKKMKLAARVYNEKSGRVMELSTNVPGLQFYTANYVQNVTGKGGFVYQPHSALCLESQGFPDSVNHPNFPSQIVRPGKTYKHNMVFTFSTR
ncbi:hypothetical protein DCAR_0207569 [Daucus carota subsp. sativus]|uniref:Aldose 1-epimerase n=2 Tax=Daucus carota subsp. sativus TaxID=79200 RepID=A0AAF1AM68_DAUCS|nr:hypothetical protein DCAR_0207569 [Daucus carota subsp. sativus]